MTQGQSQVTLLKVAKFAEICRTTSRTIRFYEKKGLIKPAFIDEYSSYRFYDPKQARQVFKIKLFQNFDMTLRDIAKSAKKYNEYSFLEKRLKNLKEEIEQKEKEYSFLNNINSFLFSRANLQKFLNVEKIGPLEILSKTIKNGRYDKIDSYIKDLLKQAKKLRIKTEGKYVLLYLEPERYGPGGIGMEAGLIVRSKRGIELPLGYHFKTLPSQKAAVYNYSGPHPYLTFVHKRIFYDDYFEKHKFAGFPFDYYVRSFTNIKSQYDFLTKVIYPIK